MERNPLVISLSDDGGRSWPHTRTLEHGHGHQSFSYPTLREDVHVDGLLHISYSYERRAIKYSRVTEQWVVRGKDD